MERVRELPKICNQLDMLFQEAFDKWYRVAEGLLTDEEIHKLQSDIMRKKSEIVGKSLVVRLLPENDRHLREAERKGETFFGRF